MNILITGSSGRIGRAIFAALSGKHTVIGLDRSPFSTTAVIGDVTDVAVLERAMEGVDAIIHTASLHAPHVGLATEAEFQRVNVDGLQTLLDLAQRNGVRRLVYTSTTALYGDAVIPGACTWIDESTRAQPKTIYHRSKLQAEQLLEATCCETLSTTVVRMSRCFPEPAPAMAAYRLHRGIDAVDVADAHVAALLRSGTDFLRFIASGQTPFQREDCAELAEDPRAVMLRRCPALVKDFDQRGWSLPAVIDRVYDPSLGARALGWRAQRGFGKVIAQCEDRSLEVLPAMPSYLDRTSE